MHNQLHISSTGQISNRPGSLLLSLEISLDQDVNQRLQTPGIDDGLDLVRVARGDVGDGPGALLQQN